MYFFTISCNINFPFSFRNVFFANAPAALRIYAFLAEWNDGRLRSVNTHGSSIPGGNT